MHAARVIRRLAWDHHRLPAAAAAAAAMAASAAAVVATADARAEGRATTTTPPRHTALVAAATKWPSSQALTHTTTAAGAGATPASTTVTTTAAFAAAPALPVRADLRQRYRVDRVIGCGGFGQVHAGRDKRSDQRVAIKRVSKQNTSKAKFLQEVDILRAVGGRHHVLSLCEAFETADAYVLVTELVDGRELFDDLVDHGAFLEPRAQCLARDVVRALAYLHANGVVHGDLKPENILVASTSSSTSSTPTSLRVKLIDFGQSFREHVAAERSRSVGSGVATVAYAAPEMLAAAVDQPTAKTASATPSAGRAIDMWALGVVLYIVLCGFHPFDPEGDATDAQLADRIRRGAFDAAAPEWTALSAAARDLITRLLHVDAAQRPAAGDVLAHAWLAPTTTAAEAA